MKFSSALKFNAVPDWWDEYMAYDTLKKAIYQLEKKQHALQTSYHDIEAVQETSALIDDVGQSTDDDFTPLLDVELAKITKFYAAQEKELLDEISKLEALIERQEETGVEPYADGYFSNEGDDDDDDDDDDESRSHSRDVAGRRRRLSLSGARGAHGDLRNSIIVEENENGSEHPRRLSISSDEGGPGNLEDSIVSLQPPHPRQNRPSRSPVASRARNLANRLGLGLGGNLQDSVTSDSGMSGANVWSSRSGAAWDTRLLFKRRITTLYISLTSLKSYVEVNYSGFRKILKKYDKVIDAQIKDRYLQGVVDQAPPFSQESKDRLDEGISQLIAFYAKCVTHGDAELAKQQLKLHQRENIAWERDTVWRQMIGRQRRGEDDEGGAFPAGATLVKETPEGELLADIPTPVGQFRFTKHNLYLLVALLVFIVLLNVQTMDTVEATRCFAILMFCTILWATEAIPLFVTSLSVPFLLVCLRVIRTDGPDPKRMDTPDAAKFVFSVMFSPTIMLLIGGFTISSALSKSNIDRVLITRVLSLAGTRPRTVILAFMAVSCFASMWISNVAAPTLCFTLIRPILRTLPPKASFGPALILSIALAANIGGQSSPISSPQNLIAMQYMDPKLDWGRWFAVALPVSFLSVFLVWLLILWSYNPSRSPDGEGVLEIKAIRPTRESFTAKQYWVSFVCLATIALWCVEHKLEAYVGDMGVIALIPIVAFFATGVLRKDDFEHFAWTIVFLAMGGIALGKGVSSSGLLEVLDGLIRDLVGGLSLYSVVLVLSPIVLIISTFISHTIASVLLVPIAQEVGNKLPGHHANLLIFITGLICSTGMGMPVSGFPNQTAAQQEDELGQVYLSNVDFLKNGVPASIIATAVVSTVGFLLMRAIGL